MGHPPVPQNNSYLVLLEPVHTTIQKACACLPGVAILQADGVQYKFGMVSSELKVIRQIPQKSLTSASLQEITQKLGKGDAQIKAYDKEKPCLDLQPSLKVVFWGLSIGL